MFRIILNLRIDFGKLRAKLDKLSSVLVSLPLFYLAFLLFFKLGDSAFDLLDGLLELAENFVSSVVARVLQDNKSQLETLGADIPSLEKIKPPFYRLTYTEASEILTSQKAKDFLAGQLEEFQHQKLML